MPPSVSVPLFADPTMPCRPLSRLTDLWRQAEIGAQFFRRRESCDVSDRRQNRRRDDRTNPRNGHQANCSWVVKELASDGAVETGELSSVTFQFIDQAEYDYFFLIRQRQAIQPLLASLTEQMTRILRDQVGMENGVYASLRAHHLFEHPHALGGLTSAPLGFIVGDPYLRQDTARI